jgi:hypothetical protein
VSNQVVYWLDPATGDLAVSDEFFGAGAGDLFVASDAPAAEWSARLQRALSAAGTEASIVGSDGSNTTVLLIAAPETVPGLRVRHRIPPERVRGRIPPERVRQVIP